MSKYAELVHGFNLNPSIRNIYLFNHSGNSDENPGVDFRQAQTFLRNMDLLEQKSNDPIVIQMYSTGGDWYAGMAIYDRIITSACKVTMIAHGQASSMSGIILQAADHRIMMPNAHFLAHYGSEGFEGDFLNCRNYMKQAEKICKDMISIYAKRVINGPLFKELGTTIEIVKSHLEDKMKNGDWYLTPEEAKQWGFIDEIFEPIKKYERN